MNIFTKLNKKSFGIFWVGIFCANLGFAQNAPEEILVQFSDGNLINRSDFQAYLDKRIDLKPAARNFSGAKAALEEMAMTRVLSLEGKVLNIPEVAGNQEEKYNDIYAHAVYQKIAPVCTAPANKEEARAYYDKTPEAFTIPVTARLSRVILPKEVKIDDQPAGLWLFNQVQLMGAGKIQFTDISTKADSLYQLDAQGDLGWVALEGENQILGALASANLGDLVGPIAEGDFVYLFQIEDKKPAAVLPWTQAETLVEKTAVNYCRKIAHIKITKNLFVKYGVKILDENIQNLFKVDKK